MYIFIYFYRPLVRQINIKKRGLTSTRGMASSLKVKLYLQKEYWTQIFRTRGTKVKIYTLAFSLQNLHYGAGGSKVWRHPDCTHFSIFREVLNTTNKTLLNPPLHTTEEKIGRGVRAKKQLEIRPAELKIYQIHRFSLLYFSQIIT